MSLCVVCLLPSKRTSPHLRPLTPCFLLPKNGCKGELSVHFSQEVAEMNLLDIIEHVAQMIEESITVRG